MKDQIYKTALNVRKINELVYWGSATLFSTFSKVCLDVKVEYESKLKKEAAILAFNHCLKFDPFILGNYMNRPIHFWIQYEGIYNSPIRAKYLNTVGGIPVVTERTDYRKNLRDLFKTTRWWLENSDDYIGIFTDSEIKDVCADIEYRDHYPGAAYMALASKKPIIPISLWSPKHIREGSKNGGRGIKQNLAFIIKNMRIPIKIGIGRPLEPSGSKSDLSKLIHQEQIRLYNQIRED